MRLRCLITVLTIACLALLAGVSAPRAENDTLMMRDPTLQRGRTIYLFGRQPHVEPRRPRVAPALPRRAAPVVVRDDPVIPKVDVAHRVLVIGDSLGDLIGSGLDQALNDRPDVALIRRARPDTGLVRTDFYDWPKVAAGLLGGEQAVSVGVVMLGLNDRQAIREGDLVHEPLSPRWIELYRERIAALAGAFVAKRVPLIWVGAPPVQNQRLSADFVSLNELYRQEAEKAGGTYVDLWGGFVDAENRYTAMGPDVSGQTTRLRLGDGIHFTAAGARKAAHFVDVVIRRLIEVPTEPGVIAVPAPPDAAQAAAEAKPVSIEQRIDEMVGNPMLTVGLPSVLQVRPLAGPIQPLSGQPAGETALLSSAVEARGRGDTTLQLDRIFVDGALPEPKPGRLDDARWLR